MSSSISCAPTRIPLANSEREARELISICASCSSSYISLHSENLLRSSFSTTQTQTECRLSLTERSPSTSRMLLDLQILVFSDWTDIDKTSLSFLIFPSPPTAPSLAPSLGRKDPRKDFSNRGCGCLVNAIYFVYLQFVQSGSP